MLEIFHNFEQLTGRFSPSVLIISGILLLLLGLCIWIAGHSLRKILISLVGLAGGIVIGLYFVGRNTFSALLAGGLAALISLIFEKVLVVLLAAAMAAAIAFTILAEPYFVKTETVENQNEAPVQATTLGFNEAVQEVKIFVLDAGEKIEQAGTKIPLYIWTIMTAAAAIILVCGIALWRLTSALFFSVVGTIIIFFGMILLLSYKGTEPISHIHNNPFISAVVFLSMLTFGTIVQLLLCKGSKEEKITKIKPGGKKEKGENESKKFVEHDWRTS
jgi:methionine-rich copper-binding protein CopC